MAPRRLSADEKQSIVELYRTSDHTTSTLAEHYGVSNSTVSRILKTSIPADIYSELISQKRSSSPPRISSAPGEIGEEDNSAGSSQRKRITRRRSSAKARRRYGAGEAKGRCSCRCPRPCDL